MIISTKPTLICLMGPTASGKTDLAVRIVQQLPCEIISVDSAMVYRSMDIGTAKPDAEILRIAPHRLLDIRDPAQNYSAGDFCTDALREIEDILGKGHIPLLVGGTMLYFHSLQNGIAKLPPAHPEIRQQLLQQAEQHGWQNLHQQLQTVDPIAAQRIHSNDPQRIQRALEIYLSTGKPMTQWIQEDSEPSLPYHILNLALIPEDRSKLQQKIAMRFHQMLQQGFLTEVEKLYQRGDLHPDLPSMRAVGYRQAWDHLAGKITVSEMQERAIIATRQLAKRQLTWLRSWKNIQFFSSENPPNLDKIISIINDCR